MVLYLLGIGRYRLNLLSVFIDSVFFLFSDNNLHSNGFISYITTSPFLSPFSRNNSDRLNNYCSNDSGRHKVCPSDPHYSASHTQDVHIHLLKLHDGLAQPADPGLSRTHHQQYAIQGGSQYRRIRHCQRWRSIHQHDIRNLAHCR